MMNDKFRIDIVGDLDYDDLIADIYFEDQILAVITQEQGFENARINIYPQKNEVFWDFRLDEFQNIIKKAKERLWQLRKISEI